MTTTTPNMGMILPDDHGSLEVWGGLVNAALTRNDTHNHTAGLGVKVPTGGINIDADLSFSPTGTPRALTDVKAIDFAAVAAASVVGLAGAFFVSDGTGGLVLNELYFRTMLGTNIQVTSGAGLNVAAFAGGFGGDYISASALASYDAATLSFWFQQPGAPRPWARMRSGDVDIYETAASIVNRVRLKSPGALAASYDVTWPAAVPGSTGIVQMSNTGALTAGNTVVSATVFSGLITGNSGLATTAIVASGVITGNAGVATTAITASGVITANAGVACGANQNVVLSGTGRYKHGTRTMSIGAGALVILTGGGSISTLTGYTSAGGAAVDVSTTIIADVGKRILAIRVYVIDSAIGPTTLTAQFRTMTSVGGNALVASSAASAGSGVAQTLPITGLTTTVASLTSYSIRIVSGGGTAVTSVNMLEVDYDEP